MINILYALGTEKMLLAILICDILHEKGVLAMGKENFNIVSDMSEVLSAP